MNTAKTSQIQRRKATYIILGIFFLLLHFLLRPLSWQGSSQLHTAIETVATVLALLVGVFSLVRFYSRKNNTFLFIGVGFLGAGLLDGFHTIITALFFSMISPSISVFPTLWSWRISRTFLAVFLFLSWWAWRQEERLGLAGKIREGVVYFVAGVFALICAVFFVFIPLPHIHFFGLVFGHPEDLISVAFLLFALGGYLNKGAWKDDYFEHWLIISLIIGFIGQSLFMFFSSELFGGMFDIAHILKNISYLSVLIGLLISIYELFRNAEEYTQQLEKVQNTLQTEIDERKQAEEALKCQEKTYSSTL